jgi:VanZ family protein
MRTDFRFKPEALGLAVYLLYLIILTMSPFRFSVSPDRHFKLLESFHTANIFDLTLNIVFFIPFGFLLFLLTKNSGWKDYTKVLMCGILGGTLSLIVETYQLFLPRGSTLSDIATNTMGAFIGAIVAVFCYNKAVKIVQYSWYRIQSSKFLLILSITLYSLTILGLSLLPSQCFNWSKWDSNFISQFIDFRNSISFQNWDPNFTFQLGNTPTIDRPWFGRIYLVAIYNRALSKNEVYTNFMAGPYYSIDSDRIKDGLIAFYNFKEGGGKAVHDSSGFGQPLDLTISNPSTVRWLTPNGLEILNNTIIQRHGSVEKLYNAIRATNKLTIEVWAKPNKTNQPILARIVSFSNSQIPPLNNFTFVQMGKNLYFLLRTPLTGLHGWDMGLVKDNFLKTEVQHLVVTYENGIERLFVNGSQHSQIVLFDSKLSKFFGRNILSNIAFCFSFFLPLGFLFYAFLLNYRWGIIKLSILSSSFSFGLLIIIEVLNAVIFPQSFDFTPLYSGVLVGIVTTLFCIACAKSGLFRK